MSEKDKPTETKKEEPKTSEGNKTSNKRDVVICHECHQEGQMSYNCPKIKCYICGLFGHKSFDCRRGRRGYQRGGRGGYRGGYGNNYGRHKDIKCFNCGKFGHKSFDCDKPNGKNCYNCGKPGHISSDCPEKKNES